MKYKPTILNIPSYLLFFWQIKEWIFFKMNSTGIGGSAWTEVSITSLASIAFTGIIIDFILQKLIKQYWLISIIEVIILLMFLGYMINQGKKQAGEKEQDNLTCNVCSPDYDLYKAPLQKATLILFPCFPCDAEHTNASLEMVKEAKDNGISIIMLKLNRQLFLVDSNLKQLTNKYLVTINYQQLNKENIYIGGFSSGGNLALQWSEYLLKTDSKIKPKGVFIVDSPIDLFALYQSSKRNVERNFSNASVQESMGIIYLLEDYFNKAPLVAEDFKTISPYVSELSFTDNIENIKNVKLRFYTEPDTIWWKENRNANYEDINAYSLQQLYDVLKEEDKQKIEYIETKEKGYKLNGTRHPHSWSIVNTNELIRWITEE